MLNLELWHVVLATVVLLLLGGVVGGRIAIVMSVVKAGQVANEGVPTLLEEAADQVAVGSPGQWTAWIIYLLRALEIRVSDEEFVPLLENIQGNINVRLATGQWPEDNRAWIRMGEAGQ